MAILTLCWPLQMPPTQKAVLISLADNADDKGYCWPSIGAICERTCFSKRAVIDAVAWLEKSGAISANRSNGRHTTYVVTASDYTKPVHLPHQCGTQTGASAAPEPVHLPHQPVHLPHQPVRELHTNHQEPSITQKSNPQSKREGKGAERFAEFWSAYPTKAAKPQCLTKWKNEGLDALADVILADVQAKRDKDRRWLDGYIPNPHTYLNQERWNDPVQPLARAGPKPSKPPIAQNFSAKTYEGTPDDQLPDFLRTGNA